MKRGRTPFNFFPPTILTAPLSNFFFTPLRRVRFQSERAGRKKERKAMNSVLSFSIYQVFRTIRKDSSPLSIMKRLAAGLPDALHIKRVSSLKISLHDVVSLFVFFFFLSFDAAVNVNKEIGCIVALPTFVSYIICIVCTPSAPRHTNTQNTYFCT